MGQRELYMIIYDRGCYDNSAGQGELSMIECVMIKGRVMAACKSVLNVRTCWC